MAATSIQGVAIRAISSVVPASIRTNDDIGGEDQRAYVAKLSRTVGVSQRRVVAPEQFSSDLAIQAARNTLDNLAWDPSSVDLVIVATQTPDRLFPGVAFQIHRALGLPTECAVFDVNLGCSAFTHGLWTASTLLPSIGRRALLVNVDTMSRTLGPDDYGNQVLFGDGAAATALETDADAKTLYVALFSDGKGTEAVSLPASGMRAQPEMAAQFVINGPAVLGLALRSAPKLIGQVLAQANISLSDIDLFVPHQANEFILDKLVERLSLPADRMVTSMDLLGNTSSCSIPLAMCACTDQVMSAPRAKVLMVGFGTGFSISAVLADLSSTSFFAPVDL